MVKKVILITALFYVLQFALVNLAESVDQARCRGYSCETVWCPDGYSIKVPTGEYVRCEEIQTYIDNEWKAKQEQSRK